jgi:hypothetical protein
MPNPGILVYSLESYLNTPERSPLPMGELRRFEEFQRKYHDALERKFGKKRIYQTDQGDLIFNHQLEDLLLLHAVIPGSFRYNYFSIREQGNATLCKLDGDCNRHKDGSAMQGLSGEHAEVSNGYAEMLSEPRKGPPTDQECWKASNDLVSITFRQNRPEIYEVLASQIKGAIDASIAKAEPYRLKKRKHGLAYALEHQLGMLHAMVHLPQDLPEKIRNLAVVSIVPHDHGEDQKKAKLESIIKLYLDDAEVTRNHLRDKGMAKEDGSLSGDLETQLKLGVIVGVNLTKGARTNWDEYVRTFVLSKTISQVYQTVFGYNPDDDMVDTIRAAILLVKCLDMNHNLRDFDPLMPGMKPTISIEARAQSLFKGLYFVNQLNRYLNDKKARPYLEFIPVLKQAMLNAIREQSSVVVQYLLEEKNEEGQHVILPDYLDNYIGDVITFEKFNGFDVARHRSSKKELRRHRWKRFHGIWYSSLNGLWELDEDTPDFKNRQKAFEYFAVMLRDTELMQLEPNRVTTGFARRMRR